MSAPYSDPITRSEKPSTGSQHPPDGGQPASPGFQLGRQNRIAKRSEFRQVYDQGRKISSRDFLAFCLRRDDQEPTRIGLTTPRALGKATLRNRIRRRVREALRVSLWQLPVGWSLVFNPRRSAATRRFAELVQEVEQVLERCAAP